MAKIFLSFLGTNDYLECNYLFNGKKAEGIRFVQQAMLEFFARDFGTEDKVYIFLTPKAKEINWNSKKDKKGLKDTLNGMNIKAQICSVDIPRGNSEDEIWKIFSIIYDKIGQNDEVIFDITHAFRSLPMLGLTLINYSRVLKNIRVLGIYYGAFETLGSYREAQRLPLPERDAPIFDLTKFDTLLQWSTGADNFINNGNSKKLVNIIQDEISPKLREQKEKDRYLINLNKFSKKLGQTAALFQTNRGKLIVKGVFLRELRENLQAIREKNFEALNPLLEVIERKVEPFKENDVMNGFKAVYWCLEHDLIQQGITLLQETVLTFLLERINNKKWTDRKKREAVSSALKFINWPIDEEKWNQNAKENKKLIQMVLNDKIAKELAPIYGKLTDLRNSINHAGYSDDYKPQDFKKKLEKNYKEVIAVIEK